MKLVMKSQDLVRVMDVCQRITSRNAALPVLAFARMDAVDASTVFLEATDLDVAVRLESPAEVSAMGQALVPARKLHEIARTLPADVAVSLVADAKGVAVKAASYKGRLAAPSVADFPPLPEVVGDARRLPQSVLRDLIGRVRFAITAKDDRYFLMGAMMEVEAESVRLVATDGHRLSMATAPLPKSKETLSLLVPRKALDEIVAMDMPTKDAEVVCTASERHLFFRVEGQLLSSRRIDAQFPAYDRIIPKAHVHSADIGRARLADGLKRAMLTSTTGARVRFVGGDAKVLVSSATAEIGEGTEEVPAKLDGQGGWDIGLSGRYVLDFLDVAGSEMVQWELSGEKQPVLMRPMELADGIDHVYVVMPMNL